MIKPSSILLSLAVVLAGCATEGDISAGGASPPRPVDRVDRVELHYKAGSQNWDNVPGPDGLLVRVMLYQITDRSRGAVRAVTVKGELEFVLYEGKVGATELFARQAFQIWRYPPEDLRKYRVRTMGLWGYGIPLAWDLRAPKTGNVTLIARYTPPKGRPVYSAPLLISLGM